jgi:hypothetical protein
MKNVLSCRGDYYALASIMDNNSPFLVEFVVTIEQAH